MAKSLVLGNGALLVCFDAVGQVRDVYYPYVGLENHCGGGLVHKIGVWVDGALSWLDDGSWRASISYQDETLASQIALVNDERKLELRFTDVVYNESAVFVRLVEVHNHADTQRFVKLFFNQQFHISQSRLGDTAYYSSDQQAIIHYKGRRLFLISGKAEGKFFSEYSTGLMGIEGKEGTWVDAHDGQLSQNPIEHGSVDSTLAFELSIGGGSYKRLTYWMTAGETFAEAVRLHGDVLEKTPSHIVTTTSDYWRAWVTTRRFCFHGLSSELVDLFKQSLLVIRSHTDNRGGIIASGDSDMLQDGRDTYSYVWPRDGTFCAMALAKTGHLDSSERFYQFCADVLTEEGYLLHKYRPDRSLGSSWHAWTHDGTARLPIQEDETALTLVGLWEHYQLARNVEHIERLYNPYIKRAADFMLGYRDRSSGLPRPSHGIWEERYAVSCFTSAAVYGALISAARFAELLGKRDDAQFYTSAAEEMQNAIVTTLYDEQGGFFAKLIERHQGKLMRDDTLDMSSVYGAFRFGVLAPDDERLVRAFARAAEKLSCKTPIGGLARYDGDAYYLADSALPGNPWFITTLWQLEYDIARATNEEELAELAERLTWVSTHSSHAGLLAEQLDPHTCRPVSVQPLAWSHAQFVLTIVAYLERLEALDICETCYPLTLS